MMNLIARMNDMSADWSFVVGHIAWQALLVGLILLFIVRLGKRWPSPIRHALITLALLKFIVPPVTNLPVGIFSVWTVGQSSHQASDHKPPSTTALNSTKSTLVPAAAITNPVHESANGKHTDATAVLTPDAFSAVNMREIIGELKPSVGQKSQNEIQTASSPTATPVVSPTPAIRKISLTPLSWLMLIHVAGCAVFAIWYFRKSIATRRHITRMKNAPEATEQVFRQLANELGCRRSVILKICDERCAPYSFGLFPPAVVVSRKQLNELSDEQMRLVLQHELVHHLRNDLFVCWCQALLTALWWFHPVIWILNRQLCVLREDCCDDFLLARKRIQPDQYCDTLLNVTKGCRSTSGKSQMIVASMPHGTQLLSDRFCRIMDERQVRRSRVTVAGAIGLLAIAVITMPGMTGAEAQNRPATNESATWRKSILVRVFDPNGDRIPGAIVQHRVDRTTTEFRTSANGEVSIPLPKDKSEIASMALTVDAAPYVVFGKYWYPQRHLDRLVAAVYEFHLEEGQSVGGTVTDTDGNPIENAKVHVTPDPNNGNRKSPRPAGHTFVATTDQHGRWIQKRLPRKLNRVLLQFRHDEYRSDPSFYSQLSDQNEERRLENLLALSHPKVMRTGHLVSGRMIDTDGAPIQGVQL